MATYINISLKTLVFKYSPLKNRVLTLNSCFEYAWNSMPGPRLIMTQENSFIFNISL